MLSAHEWKPWNSQLIPGHYYASNEEMFTIRAWFLNGARSPPVVMKDAGTVKKLLYTCTAKDGYKGNVCVHAAPPECDHIKDWLHELDLDLKYTGQGLPAISAQVLLLLIKRGNSAST